MFVNFVLSMLVGKGKVMSSFELHTVPLGYLYLLLDSFYGGKIHCIKYFFLLK